MNKELIIDQLIDIGKRLWQREYVAANDGNITVKIGDDEYLVTAAGVSKGFMTRDMIITVNGKGKVFDKNPKYKPSSEVKMHLEVYKMRDDIGSVVHAHPPFATAYAVGGNALNKLILPEAILTLGVVPVAKYATPSTMEIPESIQPYVNNSDAILLQNHGALCFGIDLETAYFRMETLEHYAKILHIAQQNGLVKCLDEKQINDLMKVRKDLNIPGRVSFD